MLCPLAAHLKVAGANYVTIVTKRAFAELFASTLGVDRVIAVRTTRGPRELVNLIQLGLRHRGRDIVIDAHNTPRSVFLSEVLGGASARLSKDYVRRAALILAKRQSQLPTMLQRYADLANRIGIALPPLVPGGIVPGARHRRSAETQLPRRDRGWIAVAPGARWPSKRWPAERFGKVVRELADRGWNIVVLGSDEDRPAAREIGTDYPETILNVAGETSIMEAAALLARCRCLLTNDSGLMHLAEAVGTPVVAVFGPTVEAFGYFPSLPSSRVIQAPTACRPCSRNGRRPCITGDHRCMTSITPDDVIEALDRVVERPGTEEMHA